MHVICDEMIVAVDDTVVDDDCVCQYVCVLCD